MPIRASESGRRARSSEPRLTFTTGMRYDTKFLLTGQVLVRGVDIHYTNAGQAPSANFHDMVTKLSYDIGEQAFSHYLIAKDMGKALTAIPVFVSRFFPFTGAIVSRKANISRPQDLAGKRVGVSSFGYNPAVWLRGMLQHHYGVAADQITWVEDKDQPHFAGLGNPRPAWFRVEEQVGISDLLRRGSPEPLESFGLDAIFAAAAGPPLTEYTRQLFQDPYPEIRMYLEATGVFPINTVITLKLDAVRKYPHLPAQLMGAFREAKLLYQAEVLAGSETDHMGLDLGVLREMGLFPDEYGIEPNRRAIKMMIQYCYEQGLIRTLFEPEDLFVL